MEDALWAQLQNTGLEEHDDKDRIEQETDEEETDEQTNEEEEQFSFPHEERVDGPQTGPKGVKADRDFHELNKLIANKKAINEYNARMISKAPMTTTYLDDEREELLVLQHDELKYVREQRLKQLKRERDQKVFGTVTTIGIDEYAEVIDEEESKGIPVIVHLFDEQLEKCRVLDQYLTSLSNKYALAKFVRISAIELDFDLVESPAILGYKNGILIANLVRMIDLVGARFDIEEIEDLLLRNGALSEKDLYDLPTSYNEAY
ncbi:thioredoxin-like protein [Thamnidium elegans]|nr:thioredoxin-like protein [Thamnidium elegans]